MARELKRKHVTLLVLWDEYIAANPDGDRYSRWCDLYRRWEDHLWSLDDIVAKIDAMAPTLAKRGPYKKRTLENSN